jgi:hypothetical protein
MPVFEVYVGGELVASIEAPTAREAALQWFDANPKWDWCRVAMEGSKERFLFASTICDPRWRHLPPERR